MPRIAPISLVLAIASIGCSSLGQPRHPPRSQPDLLAPHEFLEADCRTAFDAVQRLRPEWLRSQAAVSFSASTREYPKVVVDGTAIGDLDDLRWIPLDGVREMHFLTPMEANFRYGLTYPAGAIVIRTGIL